MINKQELHDIFLKLRAGDTSQFELLYKNYTLQKPPLQLLFL